MSQNSKTERIAANLLELIPDFYEKLKLMKNIQGVHISSTEAKVMVLMMHDLEPEKVAELCHRSTKTIYKQRESVKRKFECKTIVGLVCKIKKIVPEL